MQTNFELRKEILDTKNWVSIDNIEDRLTVLSTEDALVKYYYNHAPSRKYEMSFENFLNHFKPYKEESEGRKDDLNKRRYSLLPANTVNQVVDVLEYGASDKYEVDNWQKIPDARTRFYNAAMRHIDAWWNGEILDLDKGETKGSQLPHLAHAICCLLFLMWFDNKDH